MIGKIRHVFSLNFFYYIDVLYVPKTLRAVIGRLHVTIERKKKWGRFLFLKMLRLTSFFLPFPVNIAWWQWRRQPRNTLKSVSGWVFSITLCVFSVPPVCLHSQRNTLRFFFYFSISNLKKKCIAWWCFKSTFLTSML